MSEGNRPAVDVDLVTRKIEHPGGPQCHPTEGLVDLHQIEVGGGQVRRLESRLQRLGGPLMQGGVDAADLGV